MLINVASAIKGPKGMVSFLVLTLINNKPMEIILPMIKDKREIKIIYLHPSKNPSMAISLISPPPMPPLEITAINRNKPPPTKNPNRLFIIPMDSFINKYKVNLYSKPSKNPDTINPSGII